MKKVLIITYYWPPGSGPGVQRFLKFSKYLRDFGWEPIILTVKNGTYPNQDPTLVDDIPKRVKVFKTKTFEPFSLYSILTGKQSKSKLSGSIGLSNQSLIQRILLYIRANFFVPDARKGWKSYAIKKAQQIIQDEGIDAIITTGPPHSTHLIGKQLKKWHFLPWIADFRDPWTSVFYNTIFPRTMATKIRDKKLEDSVLKEADVVTVVSKGMFDEFSDRAKSMCTIYNGFDEADFIGKHTTRPEKFIISYVGNLYDSQNVECLWRCIRDLNEENERFKSHLQLKFVGNVHREVINSIETFGLSSYITQLGFLSHDEAIDEMMNSATLLFLIPKSDNNHLIITGKLFEYLASSKPILAIGPQGNASSILSESNGDEMIDYDNYKAMKQQLESFFNEWSENKTLTKDTHLINQFSRKKLTELLAKQLDSISK
ncbi:MAG: glycosyltransferase family 4 protein [Bacteroidota bacterium]|nr:glycosyltransferase family 4 protein [Bacteroidota bacterium]